MDENKFPDPVDTHEGGLRFRFIFMVIFSVIGVALLFLMDPDVGLISDLKWGAGFIATFSSTFKISIYIGMLYLARKALYDYVNLSPYFRKAMESAEGAGNALIAISLAMIAIAIVIVGVLTT